MRVGDVRTCQRHCGGEVKTGPGHKSADAGGGDDVQCPYALSLVYGGYCRYLRGPTFPAGCGPSTLYIFLHAGEVMSEPAGTDRVNLA